MRHRSAENKPLVAPVFITFGGPQAQGHPLAAGYPRPTKGIVLAMTVMNRTFVARGKPAI